MKTAKEARAATLEHVERVAREFVLNEVSNKIEKSICEGKYSLRMPLRGARGRLEDYASAIVSVLEEKGYTTKVCDKSNDRHDDDVYINVSWEE